MLLYEARAFLHVYKILLIHKPTVNVFYILRGRVI